MQLTTQWRQ